ncbi:hypothetical protein Hdeb2414_s0001g00018841 [Helianthus debilis subsp. tardiflorus]
MSSSRQYSHSPRKSKFLFIRCTLYYLRSFMMKLFLVNFEPFFLDFTFAHTSYDYTSLACIISLNFSYTFVTTSEDISSR